MLTIRERATAQILADKESCHCSGCNTEVYKEDCEQFDDKYLCWLCKAKYNLNQMGW